MLQQDISLGYRVECCVGRCEQGGQIVWSMEQVVKGYKGKEQVFERWQNTVDQTNAEQALQKDHLWPAHRLRV